MGRLGTKNKLFSKATLKKYKINFEQINFCVAYYLSGLVFARVYFVWINFPGLVSFCCFQGTFSHIEETACQNVNRFRTTYHLQHKIGVNYSYE